MSKSEYQDLQNNGTAFKKFRYIIITIIKKNPQTTVNIYKEGFEKNVERCMMLPWLFGNSSLLSPTKSKNVIY